MNQVVIVHRYDMTGEPVRRLDIVRPSTRKSVAASATETAQVELLLAAGIGRERARVLSQGLSRLAWTA